MNSLLNIERLYNNSFIVDIPKFKYSFFLNFIVNGEFQICWGMGWNNDAITCSLEMEHKFMTCFKTLIRDICGFYNIYSGPEAKIFEECEMSDTTDAYAEFVTWEWVAENVDKIWGGSVAPDSAEYCQDLGGLSEWKRNKNGGSAYMQTLSNIGNYFWDTYRDTGIDVGKVLTPK